MKADLPKDTFSSRDNTFHIFREIIVTLEEFEVLKNRTNRTPFEDQLLECCRAIFDCVEVRVINTPTTKLISKAEYDEELN